MTDPATTEPQVAKSSIMEAPPAQHKNPGYFALVLDSFSFRGLRNSPREVWLMYWLVVMDSFAYFSISYVLVLFLSHDFGFTDAEAGWLYGIHGVSISLLGIMFGVTVDVIGVRLTLLIGHVFLVVGRVFMTYTTSREVLLGMLFGVIPLGSALLTPTISTGLRRFTNDSNRAVAFGLYVIMLNIGALIAAPTVDIVRGQYSLEESDRAGDWNEYRAIICGSYIVTCVSVVAVLFVRDIDVDASGQANVYETRKEQPIRIMRQIFASARFWRFMLFVILLTGVRFVFRHLDATFPKFMIRTYGEDVPFASILAINPFLVIFLIPLTTPLAHFVSLFYLILIGTTITALSVAFMLLGTGIYDAILFITLFSIGESIWAPRLFEYSCMVAPKGREGTFMACASAPMFVAKLGVGGISGWLLTEYCPDTSTPQNGQCDGKSLWFIIFLMTLSSPILIALLAPVISAEGKELRDDEVDVGQYDSTSSSSDDDEEQTNLLNNNNNKNNEGGRAAKKVD